MTKFTDKENARVDFSSEELKLLSNNPALFNVYLNDLVRYAMRCKIIQESTTTTESESEKIY